MLRNLLSLWHKFKQYCLVFSQRKPETERYLSSTNILIKVYLLQLLYLISKHINLQTSMMCINFNIEITYQKRGSILKSRKQTDRKEK